MRFITTEFHYLLLDGLDLVGGVDKVPEERFSERTR